MSIGPVSAQSQEHDAALHALVDHIAKLLAAEYIELMEAAADLPDHSQEVP